MAQICWYFELHQPWRLRPFSVFDVGGIDDQDYFSIPTDFDFANQRVMEKVAEKSYRPMLTLLLALVKKHPEFRFTLSLSGVWWEQVVEFAPDVADLVRALAATGQVEFLAETYYHSLASLYSESEFRAQVELHSQLIQREFGVLPRVFRNTELVYTDAVADLVSGLGFVGMLAEGADHILQGRAPTLVYRSGGQAGLPLLLKHYQLSDDVAFRFSDRNWPAWPLTAETYAHWLTAPFAESELVNLFMDFETFGEHQWESTGIFAFFADVIGKLASDPQSRFVTPSEVVADLKTQPKEVFHSNMPVSWADVDRDLTAWVGNPLQEDALCALYALEPLVTQSGDASLLRDWRRLQTSDHFYYMCTKWAADGDVHAYFSPYASPYDAYANFNLVLGDLALRV